jgi:tetratricopeptide (TPR) repeat protein
MHGTKRMDPNPSTGESLNVASGPRIPGRNARIALVVAVAAVAGLITGGIVLVTRGGDGGGAAAPAPSKPLTGIPPLVIDVGAEKLRQLPADDVRRRVAAIVLRDDDSRRAESIAALKALPQDEPVVPMALGLAQLWAGDAAAAQASLERAKALDPYGYYGTNADNLLHLNEARGYPPWLTTARPAGVPVADLRARTKARPNDARTWLALAAALENRDRLGAIAAAKRAFALDPGNPSARIAVTVLPFDKDKPGAALAGLMRVLQASPDADAEVRVHVGLVFFWMKDETDAAAQFRQVLKDDPHGIYAQVAGVFTKCIENPTSCATTGSDPNVAR